ncbi:MAG: nucleotidyltransferase domain-containing protein [Halothiobacillaceae bacterium]|nr:nucleotidyltransferase domain-containing protein [Halothiobacillaceae bacterium]
MQYKDIALESKRIYIDSVQSYEVFLDAERDRLKHAGSMKWKRVNDHDYLVRQSTKGAQKSLGSRSPETEAIFQAFIHDKARAEQRFMEAKERIDERASFNRAARLNRVPWMAGQIARKLAQKPDLASKTVIIGTNAIYAYEAVAGIRVDSGIVSTMDLDILWDTRHQLKVAGLSIEGFIGFLRTIDPSFKSIGVGAQRAFRATATNGYIVDLIESARKNVLFSKPSSMSDLDDDLVAVEIKGMEWLISCPRFHAVAFDEKGYPVPMVVPDPRAFALHKHWLSQQDDREPIKKARDEAQARTVFYMTINHFPHLPFSDAALRALPFPIRKRAALDWGYG